MLLSLFPTCHGHVPWYNCMTFFYYFFIFLHAYPPLHTRTILQWEGLSECDMGERMRGREREYILFVFFWDCMHVFWIGVFFTWCASCIFLFFLEKKKKIKDFIWLSRKWIIKSLHTTKWILDHIYSNCIKFQDILSSLCRGYDKAFSSAPWGFQKLFIKQGSMVANLVIKNSLWIFILYI